MAAPAPLSPLAPKTYPTLPVIEGVRFASAAAGVRYPGRTDVMMALFDEPATVAGVFTRSKCPSARSHKVSPCQQSSLPTNAAGSRIISNHGIIRRQRYGPIQKRPSRTALFTSGGCVYQLYWSSLVNPSRSHNGSEKSMPGAARDRSEG